MAEPSRSNLRAVALVGVGAALLGFTFWVTRDEPPKSYVPVSDAAPSETPTVAAPPMPPAPSTSPRKKPALAKPAKAEPAVASACEPGAVYVDARAADGVGEVGCKRKTDAGLRREGHWVFGDEHGETSQGAFVDGRREGRWFFWRNGKLVLSSSYKRDQKDGYEVEWSEEGDVLVEREYADGRLHGQVTKHPQQGSVIVEEYVNGIKVPTALPSAQSPSTSTAPP